jgi:hypothetical protein
VGAGGLAKVAAKIAARIAARILIFAGLPTLAGRAQGGNDGRHEVAAYE